ncbi:hypothetical protein ACN47A_14640 [Myxococcus fulvus]|uniref:hypothetical protein n=1 Tax=Myxococcus fulvus TaxID=33 RepID=UPI003B9A10CB
MMLKPASGFVLALTVAVGMVVTTLSQEERPRDERAPESTACEAARQQRLMSSAQDVEPSLLVQEPSGALGYCSWDCSSCSTTAECRARNAGSCYNICP